MWRENLSRGFGAIVLCGGVIVIGLTVWAIYTTDRWSYLLIGFGALVAAIYGLGRLFPGAPPPMLVDPDEPLMATAYDSARRDYRRFKRGLAEGRREAFVKYKLNLEPEEPEFVWALAHSIDKGSVIASLISEPVAGVDVPPERTRIPESEVLDWMLVDQDGRIEGGYSEIAMAKIYKRDAGYVPYAVRQHLKNFADLPSLESL